MADKAATTSSSSSSSTSTSTSSRSNVKSSATFLSPVSKYNKLREDELLAQQERLKSVRVDRKAKPSASSNMVTGAKRKMESAGGDVSIQSEVWFTDGALSSTVSSTAASRVGFSKSSVSLSASLAKKQRQSSTRSSTEKGDGKSISGILKNYMKKVEAQNPVAAAAAAMTAAGETRRYLTYDSMTQALAKAHHVPSKVQFQEKKEADSKAEEMFSRAVDSSFGQPMAPHASSSSATKSRRTLKHFDSINVAKNKLERKREEEENDSADSGFGGTKRLPKRSARLVTSVKDEEVVDLEHVENVSNLETVEGSEILQALMNTGTPRSGRKFPSERGQSGSDEQERAFLQRRHLALRKKYTAVPAEGAKEKWEYRESGGTIVIERKKDSSALVVAERKREGHEEDKVDEVESAAREDNGAGEPEAALAAEAAKIEELSDDGDKESTESKIARISLAKGWGWKHTLLWLVAGSCMLCALVIAFPSLKELVQPVVPFCDSEENNSVVSIYDFDRSKALQPYTGSSSSSASCRACPLFGNCTSGELLSCLPPYELYNSACIENPEVRQDLQRLAAMIHRFVVKKATENIGNISLWESLFGESEYEDFAGPVKILLSDIQDLLAETISYGKSLSNLPREYVFNRALDLAFRDLKDIFVSENNSQIFVGKSVAPWSYQAKHQLYSNARFIMFVIVAGALLGFVYRRFVVRRIERGLIDRLVKEVRFALLKRTSRSDKSYPADYLRDDLFDLLPSISPQDRKWLRESVWPRVMVIVEEDSRVRCRTKTVSGSEMVVWEWISSGSSPSKAPNTLEAAKQALVKLAGRRKRGSRKSFPM